MDRLISEQAVIDAIDKWVKNMGVLIALPANEVTPLFESIHELSSINPQEKTGHWIKYGIPRCDEQHYKCTACGYYINFGQWGELYTKQFKYCPNCGCRMVEPQESEEMNGKNKF